MAVIFCQNRKSICFTFGLILIISLLFNLTQISGQSFESMIYPTSEKVEHVKEIREMTPQKWTTYRYYDKNGLLIRQTNYYKKQKRADYRFEYRITDSLLIIKEISDDSTYFIKKLHYTPIGQVSKYEIFSNEDMENPFVLAYNFFYRDGLLYSFDWSSASPDTIFPPRKTECFYNHKRQMVRKQETEQYFFKDSQPEFETTSYMYKYDSKGYLTDEYVETSDKESVFLGMPRWSKEQSNKYHLLFSDYDKYGQWRTSYYLTKKSKLFRSDRKIKY